MKLKLVPIRYKSEIVAYTKPERNVCTSLLESLYSRDIVDYHQYNTLLNSIELNKCLIVYEKALWDVLDKQSIPLWPDLILPFYVYSK